MVLTETHDLFKDHCFRYIPVGRYLPIKSSAAVEFGDQYLIALTQIILAFYK